LLPRCEGRIFEHGKPSPDLFLYASERMGVAPHRCAVVEDSAAGIEGASRAGMFALGYAAMTSADRLSRALAQRPRSRTWRSCLTSSPRRDAASHRGGFRPRVTSSDMSAWRRRIEREPDTCPALPLRPGSWSNGESLPPPRTSRDLALERAMLDLADRAARRIGMDRRRFLQTAGGVAAALTVYNLAGCSGGYNGADPGSPSSSSPSSSGTSSPSSTSTVPGGAYEVPPPEEVEACAHALGDRGEFIFDVHTHHVMPEGPWRATAPRMEEMIRGLVPAGCREADRVRCLDRTAYFHDMFLASDTAVALLSDVPNSGSDDAPLPWEAKRESRRLAEALTGAGAPRVLLHDVIAPNFGSLIERLDGMAATAATGDLTAFKVYTAWGPGGRGWALDDPAIGLPVVERARELGVRVLCAHKGLPLFGFDAANNGPGDLVAVAARYPDMQFVVYHSAYERATTEAPYDPGRAARGVNSLIKALADHNIPPNANVWAELGTTWREVLGSPTEAAHTIGKLLQFVGEDRVLWGTDAIWLGSPQPQIMAFRAFQISEQFQDRYGYPALTDTLKRKVFGLNAASLFRIDPMAPRCGIDEGGLAQARAELASLAHEGAVPAIWQPRGPVSRREVITWRRSAPARPW
jgi:hypothetical protein